MRDPLHVLINNGNDSDDKTSRLFYSYIIGYVSREIIRSFSFIIAIVIFRLPIRVIFSLTIRVPDARLIAYFQITRIVTSCIVDWYLLKISNFNF